MSNKTVWKEASRLRRHPKVSTRFLELEKEKEARRRLQAVSREERVLNELEKIAFGDGPVAGKLKPWNYLESILALLHQTKSLKWKEHLRKYLQRFTRE